MERQEFRASGQRGQGIRWNAVAGEAQIKGSLGLAAFCLHAVLLVGGEAAADDPLSGVLRRAGEYVRGYEREASGVVLEETYRQSLRSGSGAQSRALSADFVLISLIGDTGLYGFRDVFQVDGRAVRDRDARLERLFLKRSKHGVEQAEAILDESARFNLGSTLRTFNLPTVALGVLHPDAQGRFAFKDKGRRSLAGKSTTVVGYEERARPTLIRDPQHDRDYPARGTFAIVPETGAVLASEIGIEDLQGKHRIVVEYSWVDKLGLWLPTEMRESYEFRGADSTQDISGIQESLNPVGRGQEHWRPAKQTEHLEGAARYSNPRRFGVTTEESVTPPR